ncbi:hypothetical protein EDD17DRAFT_1779095 [Pisolithus thermaeus]|nr:hypothetical protein EDD17DRAFT_1779095 [Pisolithus thermaeus]
MEILQEVQKHIDTNQYGIGFISIRKDLGLYGTRQQGHTPESIRDAMVELRQMYPNAGTREMISLLFHERQMSVARSVIQEYFVMYEPELIRQRKARRLRQRHFWAASINDIWAVDQHDKWLRYGLALHTSIEPFSGKILWIWVWHSNHNPQLILTYFLDVVKELDIPLVTQSDPGTENFGIANAQSMLCQWHDPELVGTLQHRWMRHKKNITPEIMWSQLRRHFTPGFKAILEHGVKEGWYDIENTLERLVFRWLFIPWLQEELLGYRDCVNNTAKCRDCNKILPHGVPNLIYESAGDYGALDFRVKVDPAAIEHVRKLYIKPTHTVFDLVPPAFGAFIEEFYIHMGHPSVTRQNVWTIYRGLCNMIRQHADALTVLKSPSLAPTSDNYDDDEFPLYEGRDLLFNETEGNYYMGGLRGGLGLAVPGNEHLRQLNELENDEPVIDDDGPALILPAFSDDEEQNGTDDDW